MAQDVQPQGLDVLRNHIAPALEKGVRLGGPDQKDGGTGRGAVLDHRGQILKPGQLRLTSGTHEVQHVILDPAVHVDQVGGAAGADHAFRVEHRIAPPARRPWSSGRVPLAPRLRTG